MPQRGLDPACLVGATFSQDRHHRYLLWRQWAPGTRYAMFIGLNPSTADETANDPTVRRCIGFAKTWGYDSLCMTNLFALRSTDPRALYTHPDPTGPYNNLHLLEAAEEAEIIIAAWGNHGDHGDRADFVLSLLDRYDIHYLRVTKQGQPSHPLYLPGNLKPLLLAPRKGDRP